MRTLTTTLTWLARGALVGLVAVLGFSGNWLLARAVVSSVDDDE